MKIGGGEAEFTAVGEQEGDAVEATTVVVSLRVGVDSILGRLAGRDGMDDDVPERRRLSVCDCEAIADVLRCCR